MRRLLKNDGREIPMSQVQYITGSVDISRSNMIWHYSKTQRQNFGPAFDTQKHRYLDISEELYVVSF